MMKIASQNKQISESENNLFAYVMINLNIPQYEDATINTNGIDNLVLRAIEKYKNDSSIRLIKTNNENKHVSFRFQKIHAI